MKNHILTIGMTALALLVFAQPAWSSPRADMNEIAGSGAYIRPIGSRSDMPQYKGNLRDAV